MVGASIEAAELFGEAINVLLARGPARGLGVDAGLSIDVNGGGALFHLGRGVRDILAQVLVDHLASDRGIYELNNCEGKSASSTFIPFCRPMNHEMHWKGAR